MNKKTIKHISLILLFSLCATLLCACSSDPKNFTVGNMTITLTKAFKENKMNEFDAYITSSSVSFTAKKESMDSLEHAGYEINTLSDYAQELVEANSKSKDDLVKRGNYIYFISEGTKSGAKYTYMHCLFKGNSEYWICEFVCKSSDYSKLKDSILGWADSITFN